MSPNGSTPPAPKRSSLTPTKPRRRILPCWLFLLALLLCTSIPIWRPAFWGCGSSPGLRFLGSNVFCRSIDLEGATDSMTLGAHETKLETLSRAMSESSYQRLVGDRGDREVQPDMDGGGKNAEADGDGQIMQMESGGNAERSDGVLNVLTQGQSNLTLAKGALMTEAIIENLERHRDGASDSAETADLKPLKPANDARDGTVDSVVEEASTEGAKVEKSDEPFPERREEIEGEQEAGTEKTAAKLEGSDHFPMQGRGAVETVSQDGEAEGGEKEKKKKGGPSKTSYEEGDMQVMERTRPHPSCQPDELIYVYDLPPKYNTDAAQALCTPPHGWALQPRHGCVIYSPEFHGFGPPLDEGETQFLTTIGSPVDSWSDTGQFALEMIFHQYMLDLYPCRTANGSEAAAFYVPLYAGMLHTDRQHMCWREPCPEVSPLGWLGRLLGAHLNKLPYLKRNKGRDHITAMGRVNFDALQADTCCDNGLLRTKHTKNFVIMGIENSGWTGYERQVSVPYPTCFHPSTPEEITAHQKLILSSERPVLVSFTGQLIRGHLWSGKHLRRKISEECADHPGECEMVECNMCQCTTVLGAQLRAKFCLQPPGDTPTRRSLFDALQAGCIPVLFSRETAYDQYTSFLPSDESSYSVFIWADDVNWGRANLIEILRGIPEEELERKRAVIASMLPSITYGRFRAGAPSAAGGVDEPSREVEEKPRNPLGAPSAYDVALAEALRRVTSSLAQLQRARAKKKRLKGNLTADASTGAAQSKL